MRVAIAQMNPRVGDLAHNRQMLLSFYERAHAAGADLVVAPELALVGYPPKDLLLRPSFVRQAQAEMRQVIAETRSTPLIFGCITTAPQPKSGISNAAVVAQSGKTIAVHRKMLLPEYDVFDETRYFVPGVDAQTFELSGFGFGLTICEDIWSQETPNGSVNYDRDPAADLVARGAQVIINLSASPYSRHRQRDRERIAQRLANRHHVPVLYANAVGANDSLIFDGGSFAVDLAGTVAARLPSFVDGLFFIDIKPATGAVEGPVAPNSHSWETSCADALTLGVRDYVHKCGFERVVVGLSGGIDSALTAAIAVRALGPDRVFGVSMPSKYSSDHSVRDALALEKRLGIRVDMVRIESVHQVFEDTLKTAFGDSPAPITDENIQARIRGNILMAYANQKPGTLVLNTGNKSELAVGYCTLYGDMNGGLGVLADLYKTEVYALAEYLNQADPKPIPPDTITKAPSAELRLHQRDQDTLPPYEVLDAILRGHIEDQLGVHGLVRRGFDLLVIERVLGLVTKAEFKRRQAAPGLRVSRRAFGEGWRYPIAAGHGHI